MNAPEQVIDGVYSAESEQAVIGSILIDPTNFDACMEHVSANDFYFADHKAIFATMERLINDGVTPDLLSVHEAMKKAGQSEEDRNKAFAYLTDIVQNSISTMSSAIRAAKIVALRASDRRLSAVGAEISLLAKQPSIDKTEKFAKVYDLVDAVSEGGKTSGGPKVAKVVMERALDILQERADKGDAITGYASGFEDIDAFTCGFQPGNLIIVAARPSMGKTAMAMQIASFGPIHSRIPVAVFTLEMPDTDLMSRALAVQGRIDSDRLRRARLTDEDWSRLSKAVGDFHEAPLYIDETSTMTVPQIRSRCRQIKREAGGLGLVVIDYLQLITGTDSSGNRNRTQEVGQISRGLKALAKDLKVPVVALSQLSRKVEERADKRPMMSDLRESGDIEQDADLIMMLYRDEYYNPDSADRGIAEVIIGKQRGGRVGTAKLQWSGQYTAFSNMASNRPYD